MHFQHPSTLIGNIILCIAVTYVDFFFFCTWPECIFDFNQGLAAVCQQILGFPGVDPDHTNQKVTGSTQTNFHLQMHFQISP